MSQRDRGLIDSDVDPSWSRHSRSIAWRRDIRLFDMVRLLPDSPLEKRHSLVSRPGAETPPAEPFLRRPSFFEKFLGKCCDADQAG